MKNQRLFKGTTKYKDFTSDDIKQFAKEHGYLYTKSQAITDAETGYYMTSSYYNEKVDRISWIKDGVEFEFYTRLFTYETIEKLADSANDDKRSRFLLGLVFSVKLPYKVPSVMVQSLTSRMIWNIIGINQLFIGKRVKLEGDFNRFFRVHTPNGEAPNAFLALPPDIMVKMLKAGSGLDFQFAGDRIYFMYDIRVRANNVKNLWGLIGDMETFNLHKELKIKQIDSNEWHQVFERSREYSEDILRAFRSLKQHDEPKSMFYMTMSGKRFTLFALVQLFGALLFITAAFIFPAILLIAIPVVIWIVARIAMWSHVKRRLIKDWEIGKIKNIVR